MRRKERHRIVTPIIGATHLVAVNVLDGEFVDRHQLDSCDPQRLQVGDLLDHAQIAARCLDLRSSTLGEAANMHLVDDRLADVTSNVAITVPVKIVIDDHTLGRTNDSVAPFLKFSSQCLGVRIDQPRGRIEPMSVLRIPGTTRLEMVQLAGVNAGNVQTPNVTPAIGIPIELDDLGGFAVVYLVVKQQSHGGGRATEDRKLHTGVLQRRPERR